MAPLLHRIKLEHDKQSQLDPSAPSDGAPYSAAYVEFSAKAFEDNNWWTVDSTLTCQAAALAAKTKTPRGLSFEFSRNGQTDLPPDSIGEIIETVSPEVDINVNCWDAFYGEEIKTRGGRDKLFELIKEHKFVWLSK